MRLSKITTRTGDGGTTGLADGSRIGKDHLRVACMGSVDELNSQLGLLLTEPLTADVHNALQHIQNDLFDLGGALALPARDAFSEHKLTRLDEQIAHYNANLPPLREFILPGGCRAGALCHVARTIARRAERDLALLARQEATPPDALPFLNRLSDLLFVLSRHINREHAVPESLWHRDE